MTQDFTQITFVRHGERLPHPKDAPKYPGPGLNAKGRRHAESLGKFLKDARFDVIYCSDMTRAIETAKPILAYQKKTATYHRELAEFNKIVWDQNSDDKDKLKTNQRRAKTTIAFFKQILKKDKNKNILIVGHGNATRACVSVLLDYSLADAPSLCLNNCSVTTIRVRKGKIIAIPCMNLNVTGKPKPFKEQLHPVYIP